MRRTHSKGPIPICTCCLRGNFSEYCVRRSVRYVTILRLIHPREQQDPGETNLDMKISYDVLDDVEKFLLSPAAKAPKGSGEQNHSQPLRGSCRSTASSDDRQKPPSNFVRKRA